MRQKVFMTLLFIMNILMQTSIAQNTQVLEFGECRITVNDNYGYVKCQVKDQCATQSPSSSTSCSTYLYKEITQQQCQSQCCGAYLSQEIDEQQSSANPTDSNQTEFQAEQLNKTLSNETIINETIMNETAINQTTINETTVNETTIINETTVNETTINETGSETETGGKEPAGGDPQSRNTVTDGFQGETIKKCYENAQLQNTIRIVVIVLIVFGIVGILAAIGCTLIFGYQTNPYNGKRVWVGCCCCKKQYDFKDDRNRVIGESESDRRHIQKNDVNIVNPGNMDDNLGKSMKVNRPIKL